MLIDKIALVLGDAPAQFDYVARVAAALQQQISDDFAGEWGIDGTVSALRNLGDVPDDYGIIELVSTIQFSGVEGYHNIDVDATPHAFVRVSDNDPHWSVIASHECLEMLADPTGTMLRHAPAPLNAPPGTGDFVDYLVEVCDPCQHISYSYTVEGHGIAVSDFYGQDYFDASPTEGGQYSITKSLTSPRTVLPGGYVSFRDAQGRWMQMIDRGNGAQFRAISGIGNSEFASYRETIDEHSRKTGHSDIFAQLPGPHNARMNSRLRSLSKDWNRVCRTGKQRSRRIEAFKRKIATN